MIKVSFDSDMIYLDAPGMAQLGMPMLPDSYVDTPQFASKVLVRSRRNPVL
jgi:hypothetical protein